MSELRKLKDQLDQKFEELKKELQDNCPHEDISDKMIWSTGCRVKQCNRCGKEIARELPEELGSER